ncbi:hypothetical protein B0H12DRAFT_714254 [Mycena haematopus]|nr:hypothetical protein B0H12DRAFT_714254 [Mycena haematopus]
MGRASGAIPVSFSYAFDLSRTFLSCLDRYHPHATSVNAPMEPSQYDYGQVSNVGLNLSEALEESAIRQPTLPRLQIPTRPSINSPSPLSDQRVDIPSTRRSRPPQNSTHHHCVDRCRRQTCLKTFDITKCTKTRIGPLVCRYRATLQAGVGVEARPQSAAAQVRYDQRDERQRPLLSRVNNGV